MKKTLLFALLLCLFSVSRASAAESEEVPWKGCWINTERCQNATNSWLVYRHNVQVATVPRSLVARIAADSKYWLWINGRMVVFEGGLKRGPSPADTYYDAVEIAPYLKSGENTLAVLVWHFGKGGFSHTSSGTAALLFDATTPDGNLTIASDASWRCALYEAYSNTDAPHPNYRLAESNIRFDARRELIGWTEPGFAGELHPASPVGLAGEAPFGRLVRRPIPLWKDYGLTDYAEVRTSGDTLYCRLPYNCQLTPYLKVEAVGGDTLRIQTDNYEGGGEKNVRAEYITRPGVQEYESYGWMNGHEVRYVIPGGVKVLEVKYRETGYDAGFAGSFSCNDSFYNELWKRSARTLYVTMRDNYMDCPDRERAQWWGDEVNELGETFYALAPSGQQL
ncbi:MAG: glycoside hydrolase, partial [Tannerellaceae bacterium]